MAKAIIDIWPVPDGHRSSFTHEKGGLRQKVDLADLINAGVLEPRMLLFPRHQKFANRVITLLPDGQIDVDGTVFATPSRAAGAITGKPTNGWWFLLVDQVSRRSLRRVRRDYVDTLAVDVEDEEGEDDGNDDET
jgi:hypothetical protein